MILGDTNKNRSLRKRGIWPVRFYTDGLFTVPIRGNCENILSYMIGLKILAGEKAPAKEADERDKYTKYVKHNTATNTGGP